MSRTLRFSVLFACLCGAASQLSGCILLDDFGIFQADPSSGKDGSVEQDAGTTPELDAGGGGTDAGGPDDACDGVDCSGMDSECETGVCKKGKCEAVPAHEGDSCAVASKCVTGSVCTAGVCKGQEKDCSAKDENCFKGVCNPDDGKCEAEMLPNDSVCFDANPCIVGETCTDGVCDGSQRDCAYIDDDCALGACNPNTGACEEEFYDSGDRCANEDPCTVNDTCDGRGTCSDGPAATDGVACNDGEDCTTLDTCVAGSCKGSAPALLDTPCDDKWVCTGDGACDIDGDCLPGRNVPNGTSCFQDCYSNHSCQDGACVSGVTGSEAYPTCQFVDCNIRCDLSYYGDGECDCGCGFVDNNFQPIPDADCSDCSSWMCERRWCDENGNAVDNCDQSIKDDGKCDCGCQFVDPDCDGGRCCTATDEPGCGNPVVEDCLRYSGNLGSGDPNGPCITDEWTATCAEDARQAGCMACP